MKKWNYLFRVVAFLVYLIMPSESLVKKTTGVLDRFEDNDQAVILLEAYNREWVVSKAQLPTGSNVNTWFDIEINTFGCTITSINSNKTSEEKKNAWEVVKKLQQSKQ